jgi:putative transposase
MDIQQPDKTYQQDNSIIYSCQYHVVFCPKYRRKVLTGGIDPRLKELILEKQDDYGYKIIDMEVMPDHVHLLIDVDPRMGIVKIVGQIKGYTAHVLRKEFPALKSRLPTLWTRSKFISTAGTVSLEVVKRYIEDQKGV